MNTKESGHLKKSKLFYKKKDATNKIDKFVVVIIIKKGCWPPSNKKNGKVSKNFIFECKMTRT